MSELTIEEVHEKASNMLSQRINDMTKIKIKCWLYHSKGRARNGNEPFAFSDYTYLLGKDFYLEYLRFDLIDCDDIGGKEKAKEIIEKWFG